MNLQQKDFKEGMSITCEIEGTKIDDAKLHFEDGEWFICQNQLDGSEGCESNKYAYKYCWNLNLSGDWKNGDEGVTNIQPKLKTLYNLEEGDIVVSGDKKIMVIGVHKNFYHMSIISGFCEAIDLIDYFPKDLEADGYKVKQPATPTKKPSTGIEIEEIEAVKELKKLTDDFIQEAELFIKKMKGEV